MQSRKKQQDRELEEAVTLLSRARSPGGASTSSPSGSEEAAYSFAIGRQSLRGRTDDLI
jgi:hypothetical protein